MAYDRIRRLLRDGYPWKIRGNGGYEAVLVDIQPLVDHDYSAIYRYPGGDCVHGLFNVKGMPVIQALPDGLAWWVIIAEDSDGKIHKFRKICDDTLPSDPDEYDSIDYFEAQIRKRMESRSGHILCAYRERDVTETLTL